MNVWSGIYGNLKTPPVRFKDRVTAETYVDNISGPYVLPCLHDNEGSMLMH